MNRIPRPFDLSFLFADVSQTQLGLVPLLAGLLLVATGCSSTHQVSRTPSDGYARVTEAATGKTVKVHFRDGRVRELKNLYVGPDSTMGVVPQNQEERSFPTASIWKVETTDRFVGFLEGAGLGVGVPTAGGLLLGGGGDDFVGELVRKAGYRLSIPAGLIGGIIGTVRGHQETYYFEGPSHRADSVARAARSRVSKKSLRK
jgi:hypothetical protein